MGQFSGPSARTLSRDPSEQRISGGDTLTRGVQCPGDARQPEQAGSAAVERAVSGLAWNIGADLGTVLFSRLETTFSFTLEDELGGGARQMLS